MYDEQIDATTVTRALTVQMGSLKQDRQKCARNMLFEATWIQFDTACEVSRSICLWGLRLLVRPSMYFARILL